MDKIIKYQKIIEKVLNNHVLLPSSQFPDIQDLLLIDRDKWHFIQLTVGWNNQDYIHQIAFHVEVKSDGKVWIHENRTDILIDEELINEGIASNDIIIGMIEPYSKNEMGTQVA